MNLPHLDQLGYIVILETRHLEDVLELRFDDGSPVEEVCILATLAVKLPSDGEVVS